MGNFIKLSRKITKWEWWHDIKTYRLFTYMLIEAWWKDGKYKGTDIQRGSFPSSVNELAQETDLTINEVRTALKHLKSTGEITTKSQGKYTIFTVNNYNLYQSDNEQINNEITSKNVMTSQAKMQSDNKELTSKSQAINEQTTSSNKKEDKNINNIKELEEDKEDKKDIVSVSTKQISRDEIAAVIETWNELSAYGIQEVSRVDSQSERGKMLNARIKQYGIAEVLKAIQSIKHSDFLQGKNNRGWSATFDWFVRPNNFIKVMDGNYIKNDKPNNKNESQLLNEWRNA